MNEYCEAEARKQIEEATIDVDEDVVKITYSNGAEDVVIVSDNSITQIR